MATYNISGYNCTSDKNELNKSIGNALFTVSGNFKEITDIVHPTITMSSHSAYDFDDCNYLFIQQFGRYYFIDSKTIDTQGRIILKCTVDVLYSHRGQINNLFIIADRSSNKCNHYQVDSEIPRLANKVVATQKFPSGFPSGEKIILAVNGGGMVI